MTVFSVERKLRWCGYVLLAAAFTAPVLFLLPDSVSEAYLGGSPLFTPLTLSGVSFLGVSLVLASAAGLVWVATESRETDAVSRERAWRLAGMEGIFGWFAFGWGAPLVLVALLAALSGFQGPEFVGSLAERGVDPYGGDAALALPAVYLSAGALLLGLAVIGASVYVSRTKQTRNP